MKSSNLSSHYPDARPNISCLMTQFAGEKKRVQFPLCKYLCEEQGVNLP